MKNFIAVCQSGYEEYLKNELIKLKKVKVDQIENSYLVGKGEIENSVFAHYIGNDPQEINGTSVNQIAGTIFDYFFNKNKDVTIDSIWNCIFIHVNPIEGLSRRSSSIQEAFSNILKKRMSRVAKLFRYNQIPDAGSYTGLLVFFSDFKKCYVTDRFIYNGQRRMADHPDAPSRSFLKIEEAFSILKLKPEINDLVIDLGASPGGWSFSAALKGASVCAVDNAKLKGGASNHPGIIHYQINAFDYKPDKKVDWLLCDMIVEPYKVIKLLEEWLTRKLCRFFIINLKFGYTDIIALINDIEHDNDLIKKMTSFIQIIHLYHDRDEVTLIGITNL
jgi:23S rRNA (cytidine2498-2'-O)-methyltransferase